MTETMEAGKRERDKINAKKRYEYRKQNGICVKCGVEWAMIGFTECSECSFKDSERQRERRKSWTRDYIDKRNLYYREKRKFRIENRLCTTCGKKLKDGWKHKTCCECQFADRKRHKLKYNAKRFEELGLCRWCGGETAEGTKYCAEHLTFMRELCERNFRPNGKNIANNKWFRGLNNAIFAEKKASKIEGTY